MKKEYFESLYKYDENVQTMASAHAPALPGNGAANVRVA